MIFETVQPEPILRFMSDICKRLEEQSTDDGPTGVPTRSLNVLIVEDEFFIALDSQSVVESLGHQVLGIAVSAEEAVEMAGRIKPDVVLMDIRLSGPRDGIEAATEIWKRYGTSTVFVTANTDAATRERARQIRPVAFLEKPLTEAHLRRALLSV